MKTNILYQGENLKVMKTLPSESVDLIYIDPPFFSSQKYEVIFGDTGEVRQFEDRWKGGLSHYINWMTERLEQTHRLLKPTGSIYVHLDHHAVHYIKVEMDRIFRYDNFLNEIIWHYKRWPTKARRWQRMHDTILHYQKTETPNRPFNVLYGKRTASTLKRWGKKKIRARHDKQGKRIPSISTEKESPGASLDDVWNIPIIAPVSKERLGYPTQKPEKLLERIIRASSNEGDIVADFFCGCGTTLAVAQQLRRRWIGCDISPRALSVVKERLTKLGVEDIVEIKYPTDRATLKEMGAYEFQSHIINYIQGIHSPTKVGDYGIDGYTLFHRYPIQIKRSDRVGRPVIQQFATAVRMMKKERGFVFALGYSKQAHEEAARLKREENLDIQLWTTDALFEADMGMLNPFV